MRYKVRSDDLKPYYLTEDNTVRSVLQNIILILNTPKGSVPMYRDFGLRMAYKDRPQTVADAIIVSEVTSAIKSYEPRASVVSVTSERTNNKCGEVVVIVEVEI